jgi:glycosyltransferase involved in cell wall biosynthesis
MRIAVDARSLSHQLSGIGYFVKHMLDAIQQIDHKNRYYLISNGSITYDLKNPKWSKVEGKRSKKLTSTLWMQSYIPFILSQLNIDLFWGAQHSLPLFLSSRIKTVLDVYDLVHLLYPGTMAFNNLVTERLLMRLSFLRSDSVITVSQSSVSAIQKYYGIDAHKINLIYPGTPVFPEQVECMGEGNDFPFRYFLFVGTLDPRKNFERLFKAYELTQPQNHGVRLVFVGGAGWKNKGFLAMLKTHPLSRYIHFPGYVPRERLRYYYNNALCLLFPSLYEGFGFPILEAMSCGTPVITSNTSSMPEVAGDSAILVDPYDEKALAEAMVKVMKNKALRETLSMKGFERVKEFSWEASAIKTIEVFEKTMER